MKVKGIDVSKWQGNIDFDLVRKNGAKFVIIRAGSGKKPDPMFKRNYDLAKRAGLHVGAYWYSYANSVEDAIKEAETMHSVIKGLRFEYPIWYDVEETSQFAKGTKFINAIIYAFCQKLEAYGFYVGVYMSKAYATSNLYDTTKQRFDTWIAQYNSKCTYEDVYGMWQYSGSGKINGINGSVDLDYSYKDYKKIMIKTGLNGYGK